MLESLFHKVASVVKETVTQVFFCDFCEILKSTYFEELLRTAVSKTDITSMFYD